MKILLNDVDGYKTYVELIDCDAPKDYKTLRFITVFERSRHPDGEREAYQITLSPDALNLLSGLLK